MNKLLLIIAVAILPGTALAQNSGEKKLTKFEQLVSKTGHILKFVDAKMDAFPTKYTRLETGVRTILGEGKNSYFYRIEKPETSSSIARIDMIEYSDLVEINKAVEKLMSEVQSDIDTKPDYLENKFITMDGFEVGYYVSGNDSQWFIKIDGKHVFCKNVESLATSFKGAQTKIEELKSKYGK